MRGAKVSTGDIIVADVEGIAVIPKSRKDEVFLMASKKASKEASLTLAEWEESHRAKIAQAITSAKQKLNWCSKLICNTWHLSSINRR